MPSLDQGYHLSSKSTREKRNRLIIRLHKEGLTSRQIAHQVGVKDSHVRTIISKIERGRQCL